MKASLLIVILLSAAFGAGMTALAQDSDQQIMSPVVTMIDDQRGDFVDLLDLKVYEAIAGKLSACGTEQYCLRHAKHMASWVCASKVCDGTDSSKHLSDCLNFKVQKYSEQERAQMGAAVCAVLKKPNAETRKAMLKYSPKEATEDVLVEEGADLLALNGSVESCERYIKDYVGGYGPKWNSRWFAALAGCRIIGQNVTLGQEEKDFYTWYGVTQGKAQCSQITDSEMRNECYVPGATAALSAVYAAQ